MDIDQLRASTRTTPPPEPRESAVGSLFKRLLIGSAVATAALLLFGGVGWIWLSRNAIVSTEAHSYAVEFISANEVLRQKLGEPLSVGFFPDGAVSEQEASLIYEVKGSKHDGTVELSLAHGEEGWVVRSAALEEGGGASLWLVRENDHSDGPDPRAEHLVLRAAQLINAGRSQESFEQLQAAISIDPRHAAAYYWRGRAWQEAHDFPQAQADFEEALRLQEGLADAHEGLAAVLGEQGNWTAALPHLDRAVALSESPAATLHLRSYAHFKLDHLDQARADAQASCDAGYALGCEALSQLQ